MQVTATFSKALATAALCLTLAACSSGPSDADVQAIADQGIAQMAQAMAPLGVNLKEDFDIQVKIVNKTKQDDGRWLVQTQTTAVAKKDWPGGKKGEPMPGTPASDQMYMQKGDNGWIASR